MEIYKVVAYLTPLTIFIFLLIWGDQFGVTEGPEFVLPWAIGIGIVLLTIFIYNFIEGYRKNPD
jgi:hypothetical protein